MNPIIIAAAKFEIDPLFHTLQQSGMTPEAKLTGIGAINAAKRARIIGESCRGRNVIFVGTCGTFGIFQKTQLIRAKEVHWSPTCERVKIAYTVKDTAPPIQLPAPPNWCADLPAKKVLCSPAISLIGTMPEGFQAMDCVENLELYSCIQEIAANARSTAVILAVTNSIGSDAHIQWKQNFAAAAGMTAEYIGERFNP